jgi:hypothetical protein
MFQFKRARIRFEITLSDKTLSCVEFFARSQLDRNITEGLYEADMANFKNAFLTPKFMDMKNNKTLCPLESDEVSGVCKCPNFRSGPHCIFRCDYEQVAAKVPSYCSVNRTNASVCRFEEEDYVKFCLVEQKIQVLRGNITATPVSLFQVNISWEPINYFSLAPCAGEFFLHSEGDRQGHDGSYPFSFSYFENTILLHELTKICQSGQKCSNLTLTPYTDYSVKLSFLADTTYVDAGIAHFTSPEALPHAPDIYDVKRNEKQVIIQWKSTSCAGLIRNYEVELRCLTDDHEMRNASIEPLDCRNNTSSHFLTVPTHSDCEYRNLTIRVRNLVVILKLSCNCISAALKNQCGFW